MHPPVSYEALVETGAVMTTVVNGVDVVRFSLFRSHVFSPVICTFFVVICVEGPFGQRRTRCTY